MAPPRGLRALPRLRAEAEGLTSRAAPLALSAAAGAALAALALLLSRWCADAGLGVLLAAAAAGAGVAAGLALRAPGPEAARGWAAAAGLGALAAPALLRFLGLASAEASRLESPLGAATEAVFALAQVGALAAAAAAAWTRAARGLGAGAAAPAAAAAGGALALAAAPRVEASVLLAACGLAVLAGAALSERPWTRWSERPLRARLFAAAAAAGLALAFAAPRLLRDVWTARLHAAYPGGRFLGGDERGLGPAWAAYEFSNGDRVALRDGVIQTDDPESVGSSLIAVLGQKDGAGSVLILRAPYPRPAALAASAGLAVELDDGEPAVAATADALAGSGWRRGVPAPRAGQKPDAALLFLPRPLSRRAARRLAGPSALSALRARLADGAAAGIVFPPRAPARAVSDAAAAAAAAFGAARVADLARGTLVLAARAPETDAAKLLPRLSLRAQFAFADAGKALAAGLRWRPPPSKN